MVTAATTTRSVSVPSTKGKGKKHAVVYKCLRCKKRRLKCQHVMQFLLLKKPVLSKSAKGKEVEAGSCLYLVGLTRRMVASRRASAHVGAVLKTRRRRRDPTVTMTSSRHAGVGARRQSRWRATTTSRVCCNAGRCPPAIARCPEGQRKATTKAAREQICSVS